MPTRSTTGPFMNATPSFVGSYPSVYPNQPYFNSQPPRSECIERGPYIAGPSIAGSYISGPSIAGSYIAETSTAGSYNASPSTAGPWPAAFPMQSASPMAYYPSMNSFPGPNPQPTLRMPSSQPDPSRVRLHPYTIPPRQLQHQLHNAVMSQLPARHSTASTYYSSSALALSPLQPAIAFTLSDDPNDRYSASPLRRSGAGSRICTHPGSSPERAISASKSNANQPSQQPARRPTGLSRQSIPDSTENAQRPQQRDLALRTMQRRAEQESLPAYRQQKPDTSADAALAQNFQDEEQLIFERITVEQRQDEYSGRAALKPGMASAPPSQLATERQAQLVQRRPEVIDLTETSADIQAKMPQVEFDRLAARELEAQVNHEDADISETSEEELSDHYDEEFEDISINSLDIENKNNERMKDGDTITVETGTNTKKRKQSATEEGTARKQRKKTEHHVRIIRLRTFKFENSLFHM